MTEQSQFSGRSGDHFWCARRAADLSKNRQAPRQNTSRRVREAQSEASTPVGVIEEDGILAGLVFSEIREGKDVSSANHI
jgi:hypothetical protein